MIPGIGPMAISSLDFLTLASAVVAVAWFRPAWFLAAVLAASLFVVATWLSPASAAALGAFLLPPYVAIRLAWGRGRGVPAWATGVLIVWQVGLFVYLRKYQWVGSSAWLDHPVAIVGLSYMLFRIVHLLVEAPKMGHIPLSVPRYVAYLLAFWTLVSGPIQRYDAFCQGLERIREPEADDTLEALHRLLTGLIKAFVISPVFLAASKLDGFDGTRAGGLDYVVLLYAFPVYLYLNFSGYTDVVIALARLCGFTTLPENFNRPYLAVNTRDFWTRWHMSLGMWVRHYVFTPLSHLMLKRLPSEWHTAGLMVAVTITFFVLGAWHGTTFNFVLFGLAQGVAVIVSATFERTRQKAMGKKAAKELASRPWFKMLSILVTFHYTCLTLFLLSGTPEQLKRVASAVIGG